jgi:CheY-like chemotaxis protein
MMPQKDGLAVIKELRRYIDAMQDAFHFQKPIFVIATAYYSCEF